MGRLAQIFWYLQADPLPGKKERREIFTHIDSENEELKKLRRKYRRELRKQQQEKLPFPTQGRGFDRKGMGRRGICGMNQINIEKIVEILEQYLFVSDEWGGSKLANWRWGNNVVIDGMDEAAQEILNILATFVKPSLWYCDNENSHKNVQDQ